MKEKAIAVIDRKDVLVRSRLPLWRAISKSDTLGNEVPALCGVSGNLLSLADEVIKTR